MILCKDLHNKLVEDFELIIDYLKNNVALEIVTQFNFQIKNLTITIYPINNYGQKQNGCWFKISRDNNYFTTEKYIDVFYTQDNSVSFDLFDGYNDGILYAFVDNWKFIKERCEICRNAIKNIEKKINNFKI